MSDAPLPGGPVLGEPILIWGAGAIGGTLGAAFLRAGHDVVFVDRDADHVRAINEKGLSIAGPIFEDTVRAPAFLPQELSGTFDTIFLCVKARDTEVASGQLKPHLAPGGTVVSAQNGLNEYVIGRFVGDERVVGCFVNFGADYLEPGLVHYSGQGTVAIGEMDGRRSDRAVALHALLSRFTARATLTDNILGYLWGKMVYGAQLFATALTDDSIADVLADPSHRPVLAALAREVGAVATAAGVRPEAFDGFDPAAFLPNAPAEEEARSFDDMVAHNRRSLKSHSGIWRDLTIRKRKTEVDSQLGPIGELGARHGVATPLTVRLIAMIHEIEDGTRPLAAANLSELAKVSGGGKTESAA